jgi:uncharacterized protein
MRSLLDVNVLIALFDENHLFNHAAHEWLEAHAESGIATCPLTENGLVRILSNPGYSKKLRIHPGDVLRRLGDFQLSHDHEFWSDSLSLCDSKVFCREHILGSKPLTNIYLLGLAVQQNGRLVTFDARIPLNAVVGAQPEHIDTITALHQ